MRRLLEGLSCFEMSFLLIFYLDYIYAFEEKLLDAFSFYKEE